ncbi:MULTISPECIES: helix-turn-helix domain-containing protein [unclassified Brachybacterium]|uniref:TetR/AcrR family transcriptional regulator n=1 Tax=unclassified Brachybacterium TaxID=2623841 RepID=UPI00361AA9BC
MARHEHTHTRLIETALKLFETQGFERTTVAQIADAAGVTQMTFFRHFPSKAAVVTVDPYDPAIAAAVGAQAPELPPLLRATRGLRNALTALDERELDTVRRRVRIIAGSDALRADMAAATSATEKAIAEQLAAACSRLAARAAAAAVMAALTAALFEWAHDDSLPMADAVEASLCTLEGRLV